MNNILSCDKSATWQCVTHFSSDLGKRSGDSAKKISLEKSNGRGKEERR